MQRLLGALRTRRLQGLYLTLALGTTSLVCHAQVKNGDFSDPVITAPAGYDFFDAARVKPWSSTDKEGKIEIWKSGATDPVSNFKIDAPNGIKQFAEVNAYSHGKLSQIITGIKDRSEYSFSFWHRGRHPVGKDTIEVIGQEGGITWRKEFSTSREKWVQYTILVGVKNGNGPVTLSFESKHAASGNDAVGNFLTGIKLDETVKTPACVLNAPGKYSWFSGFKPTDKNPLPVGTVILNADNSGRYLGGNPEKEAFKGVWQVSADCQLSINWNNGMYLDTLTVNPDGKQMNGLNQNKLLIRGDRKN